MNTKLAEKLPKSDVRKMSNKIIFSFNQGLDLSKNYIYFGKQFDEKIELNEGALFDARQVAEEANHKYEETARKVKIVTHQLACIIERAEDFEANSRETEIKVRVSHVFSRNRWF